MKEPHSVTILLLRLFILCGAISSVLAASTMKWSSCSRTCEGLQRRSCSGADGNCSEEQFRRCTKSKCPLSNSREHQCDIHDGMTFQGRARIWTPANGLQTCHALFCQVGQDDEGTLPTTAIRFSDTVLEHTACGTDRHCVGGVCQDKKELNEKETSHSKENKFHMEKVNGKIHYFSGEWSQCDSNCWRTRQVECRVFVPIHDMVVLVDEFDCGGQKPAKRERCDPAKCNNILSGGGGDVTWKFIGYTKCSETCIGGTQESVYVCFQHPTGQVMADTECSDAGLSKPVEVALCNDIPCPPRWRASRYGECVVEPCSIGKNASYGIQTREITCSSKWGRGSDAEVIVADNECTSTRPQTSKVCRERTTQQVECKHEWIVGQWTKCSVKCSEDGRETHYSTRKVQCFSTTTGGSIRPSKYCDAQEKVIGFKICEVKPNCNEMKITKEPIIMFGKESSLPRLFAQIKNVPAVVFSAQGEAEVIAGTTLHLRCRFKLANNSLIEWRHRRTNGTAFVTLANTRRGRVRTYNKKKELQVRRSRPAHDGGVYECRYRGNTMSSVNVRFITKKQARLRYNSRTDSMNLFRKFYRKLIKKARRRKRKGRGGRTNSKKSPDHDHSLQRPLLLFVDKLPRYALDDLPLVWSTGEWGACSRCDVDMNAIETLKNYGVYSNEQRRTVTCELLTRHFYIEVDPKYCLKKRLKNLQAPPSVRNCPNPLCSTWQTAVWGKCDTCVTQYMATQRREVTCVNPTDPTTRGGAAQPCLAADRPVDSKRCHNKKCVARWNHSPFGRCYHSCGGKAFMYRHVGCFWESSKFKSSNCEMSVRPHNVQTCHNTATARRPSYTRCPKPGCYDKMLYCKMIASQKGRCNENLCCKSCYERSEALKKRALPRS